MTPFSRALALILTLPVLALCAWMLHGVAVPVLIAALFSIMLAPLSDKLASRLRRRAAWAPGIVTLGTLFTILAPTVLVGGLTFQQLRGLKTSGIATSIISATGLGIRILQRSFGWLSRLGIDMSAASLHASFEEWLQTSLSRLGDYAGEVLSAAPDLIVAMFLFVLALYFWLRDGRRFAGWLKQILPFPDEDTERLFARMRDAAHGVVLGQLFTGAVQAGLALAFLFALGVPGAFLWGILAFVLSFIPLFGTTPVTLGASVYLFTQGRSGAGIIMLVGLVVVGAADNLVRPLVASSDGHTHPLVALVAIFGGLATMGASGVFLGPIVAAMALWSLDLYGREKARSNALR